MTKPLPDLRAQWRLPSGALLQPQGVCTLARPQLARGHYARDFRFFEATLLVVTCGALVVENATGRWAVEDAGSLLAVAKNTQVNVQKTLADDGAPYTAQFLTFAPALLTEFHQRYGHVLTPASTVEVCRQISLDEGLNDSLQFCIRGIESPDVSGLQRTHRALGLLLALQERGIVYTAPSGHFFCAILTRRFRSTISDSSSLMCGYQLRFKAGAAADTRNTTWVPCRLRNRVLPSRPLIAP
ncbi:hypothetical protein [Pseudomonas tolaasii]|uniref:hypothetical protein n=1 Tax=Pseudomonas tolaasii TaxID=29442 RepID=UPI00030190C8|nr:hypothetical protein [Pseudomonas tolaasii]QXQ16317.1 hypothetical protein I7845_15490 [Pseudomonas tolaasii]